MEFEKIYDEVKDCMEDSCGLDKEEIELKKFLIHDLGIDSIDLMDLLYTLEKKFSISIKIAEFEQVAREETGDKPFAIDNVITPEGLEAIHRLMPEIPKEKLKEGLMTQQIPFLFTVESMCHMVSRKLQGKGEVRA